MKVNLLSYEPEGGWILYDYAVRLKEALETHVSKVAITHRQEAGWDVTLHINYAGLRRLEQPSLHCSMVTHIDTPEKFSLVKAQASAGVWGMCMSEETARRLNSLTGFSRFKSFSPPALQKPAEEKKITVMVAGRLYGDGRKNEEWAVNFFNCFKPNDLKVKIIGGGWSNHIHGLRQGGYEVDYSENFQVQLYREWLSSSDYLLVTGHDEGALSTLDALLFGVVPICTAQGFHLEQKGQALLFQTLPELLRLADRLREKLNEDRECIRDLSNWNDFAARHVLYWKELLKV